LHDNETLRFRREGGDVQQIVFTVPIEANPSGNHERLLFHHDGDKYFLSQVWFFGETKTAANSSLEFKRRVLGKAVQSAVKQLLASTAHVSASDKKEFPCLKACFNPCTCCSFLGLGYSKKMPELGRGIGDVIRAFRSAWRAWDSLSPKKL